MSGSSTPQPLRLETVTMTATVPVGASVRWLFEHVITIGQTRTVDLLLGARHLVNITVTGSPDTAPATMTSRSFTRCYRSSTDADRTSLRDDSLARRCSGSGGQRTAMRTAWQQLRPRQRATQDGSTRSTTQRWTWRDVPDSEHRCYRCLRRLRDLRLGKPAEISASPHRRPHRAEAGGRRDSAMNWVYPPSH